MSAIARSSRLMHSRFNSLRKGDLLLFWSGRGLTVGAVWPQD